MELAFFILDLAKMSRNLIRPKKEIPMFKNKINSHHLSYSPTTLKCRSCGKVIHGNSKKHAEALLRMHKFAKGCG